jgi:hypothetical protein
VVAFLAVAITAPAAAAQLDVALLDVMLRPPSPTPQLAEIVELLLAQAAQQLVVLLVLVILEQTVGVEEQQVE